MLKGQQEGQSGQRRGVKWKENGSERSEGQKRESMLIWSLVSVQAYSKCDGNLLDAFKPKSNKKSVVTELSCAT